ncbi:MAG: E3 binding domain-containing protein, partial [Anaerolineales bacterium]|nr:E3 binding domain-containing protein [Anaerolineales bacterium]
MPIEIKMPQLGESVTEGTVGSWLKSVGDHVEKYDPLLEVISDKVDTEVTATDSGTLLSIEVPEGETVPVGTVLCLLGEAGEATGDASAAPPAAEPAPPPAPAPEPEAVPAPTPAPAPQAAPHSAPAAPSSAGSSQMITPVVARMIAEHNIDISQVEGTGRDGRVTKRDIEGYLASRDEQAAAPAPQPATP